MDFRLYVGGTLVVLPLLVGLKGGSALQAQQAEVAGVRVKLVDYHGPATFWANVDANRNLQIEVDPQAERRPLLLSVELPGSSQTTWAADVEVVDGKGRPLCVRRSGIEWHKLLIPLPAERGTYVVRVVEPPGGRPRVFADKDREAADPATGLRAAIQRWPEGRRAALSIRFDDSHPTHLSTAIPILREYGFRGTFMICPGARDFEDHRAEWEAVARRGDQEFANHSMHHRGAVGDDDMEAEIGEAARAIWKLCPGKSPLLALNLGGGTTWETTKTLRYYLDKYHCFDASSGSLGMDDVYGDRPSAFRQQLERHLARGGWCRIHFHAIGQGLNTSEANFRAAMEIAKEHEPDLWIAGMADIHKYQAERQAAKLEFEAETDRRVLLKLSCFTDLRLYDQPLTIDIVLPSTWSEGNVKITRAGTQEGSVVTVAVPDAKTIRFHALPVTAAYVIERGP